MSVPSNLMQQMLKQQGGAQPQGAAGTPQGPGSADARTMPPAAAPFSTPQEKRGLKATALANVDIAAKLLSQALPDLGGMDTDEGKQVMEAIEGLLSLTHEQDNSDLVPAEIMAMVKSLPQMGGGTPIQQELARQQQEKMMADRMKMQQGAQPPGGGQPPQPPGQQPGA